MTLAHRIEPVLSVDGTLLLEHLPFQAGQVVEVIVRPVATRIEPTPELRGAVIRYDDPFEPVAEDDWDVLQ